MHVVKKPTLIEFWRRHADSKSPLEAWWHEAKITRWEAPAVIKARYPTASILRSNRVVFNIGGRKYRLVVKINYPAQTVFIRFIGTHQEYDKIDAEEV